MTQSPPNISFKDFRRILGESPTRAAGSLEAVHAADIAGWLQDVPEDDAWLVFAALPIERRAEVLDYADEGLRAEFVPRLSALELRAIAEELPVDQVVDILSEADERVTEDVLDAVPDDLEAEIRELSTYEPDSAGGVMTTEFIVVDRECHVGDAIKLVRKEGDDEEIGVFVVDEAGSPLGYISDRALLATPIHTPVSEVMVEPFTIEAEQDQEDAATILAKYNLSALAVVDPTGGLVGVISAEDAAEVFEHEVDEDILKLVGTSPGESQQTRLPVILRVRQRLPLMGVTVVGGLASAWILGLALGGSEAGSTSGVAILRYLPLIIGLAGNVGIQSSTILVRGFATGEVEPEREARVLFSEFAVGTTVGLLCGLTTTVVASVMQDGAALTVFGVAVGTAVFVSVTWAALLGCLVPITCRRSGIDPAIVAGPFLICLSDVSGSAIYIAVARALQ